MNRRKEAAFLADCLAHMPRQPDQVQRAVDIAIDGLKRISNGGEWPEEKARAAAWAATRAAYWAADWSAAARAAARAAAWAARAAALAAAAWAAARAAARAAAWAADAADSAARAHPDPAKERARQAQKRKDLGL